MSSSADLDENLYSRQLYVLGKAAMQRIVTSRVLILGLGGLGAEIAKNVILAGAKSVTLYDPRLVTPADLGVQCFLSEGDIAAKLTRDTASCPRMAELNGYVEVQIARCPSMAANDYYSALLSLPSDTDLSNLVSQHDVVVLTESTFSAQMKVNDACRAAPNNVKMVAANCWGLCGQVFCDFGPEHIVLDKTGEQIISAFIQYISKEENGTVVCCEQTPHGIMDNMFITFADIKGMTELNNCPPRPVEVINRYTLSIGDTSKFSDYRGGGTVTQVKMPEKMEFLSLRDLLSSESQWRLVTGQSGIIDRPRQLHLCTRALDLFLAFSGSQMPRCWHREDAARFVDYVKTIVKEMEGDSEPMVTLDERMSLLFALTCAGHLPPMNSVVGGYAAQEVMKAISGQLRPTKQWFYFDSYSSLPGDQCSVDFDSLSSYRHLGQISVFGMEFQEKLAALNYFIVGAGAIGCELVKLFSLMGVCESGQLTITDMDTIEKSNLNRQFLFRPDDIGKAKSTVAAHSAKRINPKLNITAHENRLGAESDSIYDAKFYASLSGTATALDNVEARQYLGERCRLFGKSMLDSGTMGVRGNVTVIVPGVTDVYRPFKGGDDVHIPVCTLKNFPYEINHTIQWARDLFAGLFTQAAQIGIDYLRNKETFLRRTLALSPVEAHTKLSVLTDLLVTLRPNDFRDCVMWAVGLWHSHFVDSINTIRHHHPPDKKTSSGMPFWSGVKRCPEPLSFSPDDPLHLDFVVAASNLRATLFSLPVCTDPVMVSGMAAKCFQNLTSTTLRAAGDSLEAAAETDEDLERLRNIAISQITPDVVTELVDKLATANIPVEFTFQAIEFEKDDDSNFHMDFITAASNSRAVIYSIEPVDRLQTKRIAGKIIPAIATTTAFVAGLVCLELYKLVDGPRSLSRFSNNYCNLGIPFVAFVDPAQPPPSIEFKGKTYTPWDFIHVNKGDITLRQFLDHFKEEYDCEISMVSQDTLVFYAAYMSQEKLNDRMDKKLSEVVSNSRKSDNPGKDPILLEIVLDSDDYETDIPVPRVKFYCN